MNEVPRISWRAVLTVLISYGVAAAVAGAAVLFLLDLSNLAQRGWSDWSYIFNWDWELVSIAIFITLVSGFVPFLGAIALLRAMHKTGWLAHILAGLAVSFVAQVIFFNDEIYPPFGSDGTWPILAGGAIAGLVYWAIRPRLAAVFAPAP